MSKTILVLSFLALVIISAGTAFDAQNPVFWLADSSTPYQICRIVVSIILLLQIASRPPRWLWFRVVSGVFAACIGLWTIYETLNSTMMTLDSLSLMASCIAIAVTSWEGKVLVAKKSHSYAASH